MMDLSRKAVLCALALGLLACVNARTLTQTGASCAAAGFLEIYVTDGTCEAEAEVTCSAAAQSESEFKVAVKEWYADDYKYLCNKEKINAIAKAFARAVAKMYASALVKAKCSSYSQGSACGWGIGQGSAWAVATAKAIAIAAVDLGPDRAICEADIQALSGVFADVAGKAQAAACQKGVGSESDYQDIYLESVWMALADTLAYASAEYCNFGPAVIAKSKCKGRAGSFAYRQESESGSGDGSTDGGKLSVCSGYGHDKCCPGTFRFSNCNCQECNGPWSRIQDYSSGQRVWKDQLGNQCLCP